MRAAAVATPSSTVKINGWPVSFNDTYRPGTVVCDYNTPQPILRMSNTTCSALLHETKQGGHMPLLLALEKEMDEAEAQMQTKMVDLGAKTGRKVVDRRTVTRYSDDRVDFVCRGISDLSSQLATLLGQGAPSEGSVAHAAKRYAELAAEMKKLRAAMVAAEGHFEVAQIQVMKLMGGDDA